MGLGDKFLWKSGIISCAFIINLAWNFKLGLPYENKGKELAEQLAKVNSEIKGIKSVQQFNPQDTYGFNRLVAKYETKRERLV